MVSSGLNALSTAMIEVETEASDFERFATAFMLGRY
jgi:hypothetical protein